MYNDSLISYARAASAQATTLSFVVILFLDALHSLDFLYTEAIYLLYLRAAVARFRRNMKRGKAATLCTTSITIKRNNICTLKFWRYEGGKGQILQ